MQARCVLFTTKYTVHNLKQCGFTPLTVCFVNTGYIWIDQYKLRQVDQYLSSTPCDSFNTSIYQVCS